MSEWDFLWEDNLSDDDLMEAVSSGGTDADRAFIDEQEKKKNVSRRK